MSLIVPNMSYVAMTDGAFTGNFAQIDLFLKGLDGYIGLPNHRYASAVVGLFS